MGRLHFQNHWMDRPEFVDWLRRDSNDVFRAYCLLYRRSFDVKNMGEGAVKSRCRGKHVANMMQSKQLTRTMKYFHSHRTSRDQKHILGRQVNLPSGKPLSLGYEAVCVEDSSTLLDNVIVMIDE